MKGDKAMYIIKMRNPKTKKFENYNTNCKTEQELKCCIEQIWKPAGYTDITYSKTEEVTK